MLKKQKSRAKGIGRAAIAKIQHERYKACIFGTSKEELLQHDEFYRIATKSHEMTTKKETKVSLCTLDDKRHYIDGIHSRAHGHWRNEEQK